MNTRRLRGFIGLLACLASFGCASLVHGRYEKVAVLSDPPGTSVRIECNDGWIADGVTPASLKVPRKAEGCSVAAEENGVWVVDSPLEVGCDEYQQEMLLESAGPRADTFPCMGSGQSAGICVLLYVALFPVAYVGSMIADRIDDYTGAPCRHEPNPVRIGAGAAETSGDTPRSEPAESLRPAPAEARGSPDPRDPCLLWEGSAITSPPAEGADPVIALRDHLLSCSWSPRRHALPDTRESPN